MSDINELKNKLEEIDFVDEENKMRVYETLDKFDEAGGLDEDEKDELMQIMEDEIKASQVLLEFAEMVKGNNW